jgi:hypothetical protein
MADLDLQGSFFLGYVHKRNVSVEIQVEKLQQLVASEDASAIVRVNCCLREEGVSS